MSKISNKIKKWIQGYRGTAIFAITTMCNCRCIMCDMWKLHPQSISLEDGMKIIDFLDKHRFLLVYFTGGEPSLHPNLIDFVDYANKLGLVTSLTTNGTMNPKMLEELAEAGLHTLSVSLDHWDPKICEDIRRHKNIQQKELKLISRAREIGIRVYALVYINPLLQNPPEMAKMIKFVNEELKVPIGFCYPTVTEGTSYKIGGEIRKFDENKLLKTIKTIITMKKKGYWIANPATYLEEIIRFLERRDPLYPCKGGECVLYIDWNGDAYPCFIKPKLFNILKDNPKFIKNQQCTDCLINCFREPSLLYYLPSIDIIARELRFNYKIRGLIL